jgi:succinate dehydrogenase / fumarate reductase flavoprotein subunit
MPPRPRTLPARDVVARSMAMEIREGRGVGKEKDHIFLHLNHIDPKVLHERLPGITETGKIFAGVDLTRQPLPVVPTVHYNMGGIPTNYHGEVVQQQGRQSGLGRPRPVRGRRSGLRVGPRRQPPRLQLADRPGRVRPRHRPASQGDCSSPAPKHNELPKGSEDYALGRLDHFRNAKGGKPTAQIRADMQKTMQRHCAVFRDSALLAEGVKHMGEVYQGFQDVGIDRSLADLEHRSGRDARTRQSDRPGAW